MKIEALNYRRRDDRVAAIVDAKAGQIAGRFFAADAFDGAFKRKVKRDFPEPGQRRRPPIEADARQLANANLRVLQAGRL